MLLLLLLLLLCVFDEVRHCRKLKRSSWSSTRSSCFSMPPISADRTFMKRVTGSFFFFFFLRTVRGVSVLNSIGSECSGENRLGNQEKSHGDVCLSHMTSGIQWQAMEAHKKVYYQVVNCPSHKKEFRLQQFSPSLRIKAEAPSVSSREKRKEKRPTKGPPLSLFSVSITRPFNVRWTLQVENRL